MSAALDWNIRVTDLAIVVASFTGPFLAVYASEWLRKRSEARARRIQVFRTLMASRSTPAAPQHVEAINVIEIEFKQDAAVIDAWRCYRKHLDVPSTVSTAEAWEAERRKRHSDLLFAMSRVLKFPFGRSDIEGGTYTPVAHGNAEAELAAFRRYWVEVLEGKRQLPMKAEVTITNDTPPAGTAEPTASHESSLSRLKISELPKKLSPPGRDFQ